MRELIDYSNRDPIDIKCLYIFVIKRSPIYRQSKLRTERKTHKKPYNLGEEKI